MTFMRGLIPWWAKIGAKIILSRVPIRYRYWQSLGLFRHGDMDSSHYAIRIFNNHVEKIGGVSRLYGKTVLELGPGDSVASAIIAATHGARSVLVDAGRFVRADIAPYLELERALVKSGLRPPHLSACRSIEGILDHCNASYMTEGLESLRKIEDASVDMIFSQAVLEHVRRHEFLETMQECRRILETDGICSHQVDLRDHLGGGLNNLRFSDNVWESKFFSMSGFYTNRIQCNQMLNLFRQAGFQVQVTDVRRWGELPTPRNKLAEEFSTLPNEELCISGFDVLLR